MLPALLPADRLLRQKRSSGSLCVRPSEAFLVWLPARSFQQHGVGVERLLTGVALAPGCIGSQQRSGIHGKLPVQNPRFFRILGWVFF